jgi:acyl-CoA reductase-like NAD-dependent aldehyde dehydrogenase
MVISIGGANVVGNVIGGKEVPAINGGTRVKIAPATGEDLATLVESDAADVDAAYAAAAAAQREWAGYSVLERKKCMLAWADNLRDVIGQLAEIDSADGGSPLAHGEKGVANGIEHLEHFAGLGYELTGETIPVTPGNLHMTIREPYGVVGILTPFNGPSFFPIKLSAPALAAGNAVIVKPSEQTPISATLIASTAHGALPDGLFNVVQGGPAVGEALVTHPEIHRLHLTGGVTTGLKIQEAAARSGKVKEISLELGGKNPLIVFPDIDPEEAATVAVRGMNFGHQGQSCGSTSRLFVHQEIAAEVSRRVAQKVGAIKLGLPEDPETEMASLVSRSHQERVLELIEIAKREGADVLTGGKVPEGPLEAGCYVEPTVLGGVTPDMTIARTEVFGPVLSIIEWSDEEEMIEAVNSVDYGLTGAVWSKNIDQALRTVQRVQSGYLWVNGVEKRWLGMPFGGYKNSGTGHEHSRETMMAYTRQKSISIMLNRAMA